MTEREHSPLGASGAYRWMKCPGSVGMAKQVPKPEPSEYAIEGTAAHTVAAHCLEDSSHGTEPWKLIGRVDPETKVLVTAEMADAVGDFVFPIRNLFNPVPPNNVEHSFHCLEIHPDFYGTADFWSIKDRVLHVWDYKHGQGIPVDVKWNPQIMYYGCGVLYSKRLFEKVDTIALHIVQPRCPHADGPHREWSISVKALKDWLWETLVPAMKKAEVSDDLCSGSHCRFCPVVHTACPQLLRDAREYEEMMARDVKQLTNEEVGRLMALGDTVKIIAKEASGTAYNRLQNSQVVPGRKLANAKVFRVWREGAEDTLVERYGDRAYEEKKLKSPSQIEKMVGGEDMAAKLAFKPSAGLVVVQEEDSRMAVNKDTKSMFKPTKRKGRKKK